MSQAVFMHFIWAITLIFILQLHIEVAKARVYILLNDFFFFLGFMVSLKTLT